MNPIKVLKEQNEIARYQLKDMGLHPGKYKHLQERHQTIYNNFVKFLTEKEFNKAKILDMGCRSGEFLEQLNLIGKNIDDLHGIDICDKAIDLARHERGLKRCIVGDIHKTNYDDSYFDVIVASHVIEHCYNIELIKNELKRIIKPDGKIFILIPIEGKPQRGHEKPVADGHNFYWSMPNKFIEDWNDKFEVGIVEISLSEPNEKGQVICNQVMYLLKPKKDSNEKS